MVGYAGSNDPNAVNPTYQNVQDFAEAIRISFDPSVLTYEDLMDMFLGFHSPSNYSSQYRSAVFFHTEEQKEIAQLALKKKGGIYERTVAVEKAGDFFQGEEYHQNYLDKQFGKY